MKSRRRTLICALVALASFGQVTLSGRAQDPSSQPTVNGVSFEDAAKLRQQFQSLGQAFGVEVEAKSEQSPAESTKKTMAEVADKALDMVSDLTAQLDATLKKIAPDVWSIMLRQQYAKALALPIVPFGILAVLGIYFRQVNKRWLLGNNSSGDEATSRLIFGQIIPIILMLISAVFALVSFMDSVMLLINPQYYAIKDLLTVLLNPGV